ncbi:unnamed protein product, partial [Adineta ricciae]
MFDYSTEAEAVDDDDDNEFDLEEEEEEEEEKQEEDDDNDNHVNQLNDYEQINDDNIADHEDNNEYNMKTIKTNFNNMKIFDEIELSRRDSYFKMKINDSYKYVHKQSACWLLTD